MKQEYKIVEVFNPKLKNIEEKLNEAFITYLTEKLVNQSQIKISNGKY